jgi:ATP-dependent protease HslVU (ClpYQ) ATPase subunit
LTNALDVVGTNMLPKDVVAELNRFIVGQDEAKRAVAIALRML